MARITYSDLYGEEDEYEDFCERCESICHADAIKTPKEKSSTFSYFGIIILIVLILGGFVDWWKNKY